MTILYKIGYKLCPYCKNEIKELAKKCQYCKKMVTKICPFCEAEIPITAKKCRFCGEWFEKKAEEIQIINKNNTTSKNITEKKTGWFKYLLSIIIDFLINFAWRCWVVNSLMLLSTGTSIGSFVCGIKLHDKKGGKTKFFQNLLVLCLYFPFLFFLICFIPQLIHVETIPEPILFFVITIWSISNINHFLGLISDKISIEGIVGIRRVSKIHSVGEKFKHLGYSSSVLFIVSMLAHMTYGLPIYRLISENPFRGYPFPTSPFPDDPSVFLWIELLGDIGFGSFWLFLGIILSIISRIIISIEKNMTKK